MKHPLFRLLALSLILAAPVRAAFVEGAGSLESALSIVQTAPAFRTSMLAQIQVASTLAGQTAPSLSLTPLLSPIAAPAPANDLWRPESARLVASLVAQPEAIADNKEALRNALGEKGFLALTKAAGRIQTKAAQNPALKAQLDDTKAALNFGDPAAVTNLSSRLNALFENSRSAAEATAAPAVVADESHAKKPLVGLVPHGQRPAMSAEELDAYIEKNAATSPRGLKRVNFASGDYRPEYDAALRRHGVDQIVIKTPSRAELAHFSEEDGYHLKSEYERWVMTTRTLDEHKTALGKSQRVRQFENQLEASASIPTKIGPLTVEDYEKWYPIYNDEVVGKPGGKRNVAADFAQKLKDQGKLDGGWYGLFYYDPADPTRMVGGVIMKAWPERGMFVLGYAAYRPDLKDVNPSVRTFAESMKLAKSLGFRVLSFGQDTNFFGYDYNLGLMSNKAGFLLTPYPEDEIVLLKVLDHSKPLSVKNGQGKSGGDFFFGIKRDAPLVARYLESRDAGAPKEAQDLLGSNEYFDGKVDSPESTVVGWHYKGDDQNALRVPVGISVVDKDAPAH